jgi:succinate dehydrogenase flavin-adding protein (antitoxin of CptAB toxin-antitoxin module)
VYSFIINHSEIVKCDPVKDIVYQDIKMLNNYTNSNFVNYNKWKSKPYNNGFTIENVASTPRNKHRIVIYNKGKELDKADNKLFLNTLSNKDESLEYYKDKTRIELNINTKAQIRELLEIEDNQLMSVLNSDANPILAVLNKALKEPSANTHVIRNFKEYQYELV